MIPLLDDFREWGESKSHTFKFWTMFLDVVQTLLFNIRSSHTGDFDMHLGIQANLLPLLFATSRKNYSRFVPVYILDLTNLPHNVKQDFSDGQLIYREKPGKFNALWTDMGVEKTVIRDSKGDGGILALTRKPEAMLQWHLTRHRVGEYATAMKERSGVKSTAGAMHSESYKASLKRDEHDFKKMFDYLQCNMTSPFNVESHPEVLINISTGMHATKDIQESLLGVFDKGKRMMEKFVNESLSTDGSKSFYNPIPQNKLRTFEDQKKMIKLNIGNGKTKLVHMSPEMIFRRALTLSQYREDVSMKTITSYPIGAVPTSMFDEYGMMRKNTKSDLCDKLESEVQANIVHKMESLPHYPRDRSVYIRDTMSIIQGLVTKTGDTFNDIANRFADQMLKCFANADTVIDVFDRYDNVESVKALERALRESKHDGKVYQVIPGRVCPPWEKCMGIGANKIAFNDFLCGEMEAMIPQKLDQFPNRSYFTSGGYKDGTLAKVMTCESVTIVEDLLSTQEEADTRMILHMIYANAAFAAAGVNGRIIVRVHDTDVKVLCIRYFPKLSHITELWIESGYIGKNYKLIPIHQLCDTLSAEFVETLPIIHAITGCDATSSFFYIGKKTAYDVAKGNLEICVSLTSLLSGVSLEAYNASQEFIAKLYDRNGKLKTTDVNEMRGKLCEGKPKDMARIPLCKDALEEHIKRVIWMTKLWYNAHICRPQYGDPRSYGWQMKDNILQPIYFKGHSASEHLDMLVCMCKNKCTSNCSCKESQLPCIASLCSCAEDCSNQFQGDEEDDE